MQCVVVDVCLRQKCDVCFDQCMDLDSRRMFDSIQGNRIGYNRPNGGSDGYISNGRKFYSRLSPVFIYLRIWWWWGKRSADCCVRVTDRWGGGSVMEWGGISFHCTMLHQWGVRPAVVPFLASHRNVTQFQQYNARLQLVRVITDFLHQQNIKTSTDVFTRFESTRRQHCRQNEWTYCKSEYKV